MKRILSRLNNSQRLIAGGTLWVSLYFLIGKLFPAIPCNRFIQGDDCLVRETTSHRVAEIILLMAALAFVWLWLTRRPESAHPSQALGWIGWVLILGWLILRVIGLVEAG